MHDPNVVLRQTLIPVLVVIAALFLLAVAIYWIRAWLHDNDDPAESIHELLSEYRELNRRGELSDEEYRIIKSRMAPRIGGTAPPLGDLPPSQPKDEAHPGEMDKDFRTGNP
jgi:hypothetical protein